jgi:hypothetical protein
MKQVIFTTSKSCLVISAMFLTTTAFSQTNDTVPLKEVPVTIERNGNGSVAGYLQSATDSSITISSIRPSELKITGSRSLAYNYNFKAADISAIIVKKKSKKWVGVLIGFGIGTFVGALVSPKEPKITPSNNLVVAIVNTYAGVVDYTTKTVTTMFGCGLIGGGIGALVAPGRSREILINGQYHDLKKFIDTYKNY